MLGKSVSWVRARLRLTTLSPSWRKAFAAPNHPIAQFPVGHLDLIAALSEEVQERVFREWEGWWEEGVPLKEDLRRMVAEQTRDLRDVPWDVGHADLLPDAPACTACPHRDSVQGDLFTDLAPTNGKSGKTKSDRCLDMACFEAKKWAVITVAIEKAREKYGAKLRIETTWADRNLPIPEDVKVHREHELTPLAKTKGGFPVLRLRTRKVQYMTLASRSNTPSQGSMPLDPNGKPRKKTMAERKEMLEKRRLVRALDVFCGSLLNKSVSVGTEKHREVIDPPEPQVPELDVLLACVLGFGTGRSVDPDEDGYDDLGVHTVEGLEALLRSTKDETETRRRMWNRVRGPIAKSLQTFSGMAVSAAKDRASLAGRIASTCGLSWEEQFVDQATEAIPEPASWAREAQTSEPRSGT